MKNGERWQKYKCSKCGYETKSGEEITKAETKEQEQKIAGYNRGTIQAKFDLNFIVSKKCKELQKGITFDERVYQALRYYSRLPVTGRCF